MMLEMPMQSVFGIVDVLFVGRLGAPCAAADLATVSARARR